MLFSDSTLFYSDMKVIAQESCSLDVSFRWAWVT